jgi:putative ABC transport system permease protein
MGWLRFWRREKWDKERAREIEAHLEIETQENIARGMTPEEARYAARRKLGNVTLIREEIHRMNSIGFLETLWQDVRYAVRMLAKYPTFTAVAVLTLALGIGANTAIFSLIDSVMLKTLPVEKPEELLVLAEGPQSDADAATSLTYPLWEEIRNRQDVFSGMLAWSGEDFDLAQGGEIHKARGLYVSGDFFRTLGLRPAAGRLIAGGDDLRGCTGAVVLSHNFWQGHYGGGQNAIGSKLSLSQRTFEVIGVTAPGFFGLDIGDRFDVAIPVCAEAILHENHSLLDKRDTWWLHGMGRMKPGISAEQVDAWLRAMSPQILAAVAPPDMKPDRLKRFTGEILRAVPGGRGRSSVRRAYGDPLKILLSVAGTVLLIACANIAGLMLARAVARSKEISTRLALGASRLRLIRQLLTECVLLSSAGALLGVLFAAWGSSLLVRLISTADDPVFLRFSLDGRVLGFTTAAAALTGLLFGMLPALRSTRVSLTSAMKGDAGDESGTRSHGRTERWAVASQMALSVVLLVVAGLFLRSFGKLATLDAGFDRRNVLLITANSEIPNVLPEQRAALNEQILERLKALPGALSASESAVTPIGSENWFTYFHLRGEPAVESLQKNRVFLNGISPSYFTTLRSPLLAGRDFDARDAVGAPRVCIVNQTIARKFFPHSEALGEYLVTDKIPGSPAIQIVGLVKDAKYETLREDTLPTVYFPLAQITGPDRDWANRHASFEIRTASRPSSLARSAEAVIGGINKSVSIKFATLEQHVDDSLLQERLLATLSGFFGGLALLLASIGLYGTLAFLVTRRRKEIGVRMALGASRRAILRLVLRDVSVVLMTGVSAGIMLSFWATRLVQKMLFELSAHDGATLFAAVTILCGVALLAGYLPARRATRVDPMVALRYE